MVEVDVPEAVRQLLPQVAARAKEVDAVGGIPDRTIDELIDAGVFRILQPTWCGGLENDPSMFYELIRTIAGACGSTGWVASFLGVSPWHVALFDERAQRDVWSDNSDTLVCSAYAPVGRLIPVQGGYELSGNWRFASGCTHAAWALLGGTVVSEDGQSVDIVTALVPRSDYYIENVWDAVGLRGTANNDLYADRAFVPEYRILRNFDVALRRGAGQKLNPSPLYSMPYGAMFSHAVTAPILGFADGALREFLEHMRNQTRLSLGGRIPTTEQQIAVGRAESELDAALLQMNRNLRELYECTRRTGSPADSIIQRRRALRHVAEGPCAESNAAGESDGFRVATSRPADPPRASPWTDSRRNRRGRTAAAS